MFVCDDSSVFPVWLDVNHWEGSEGQPLFSGILTRVKKDDEASSAGVNTGVQTKLEYLGEYLLCDTLGKGSSASVKLGRHSKTGQAVRAATVGACAWSSQGGS